MSWLRRPAVLAILVGLIGSLVFLPGIVGGWLYDDHLLIPDNPYIHDMHLWPRWFLTHFWDVGEEYVRLVARIAYWRPIVTTSYAVDWQISGGTPLFFHVMNLVWHALVGALAFLVLRRWIGATWPALVGALLFATHPTKAESVAWISGRTDVICMIAVLLVAQGIGRRLRGERGGLVLEFVGTVIAYTSKEQAIILPAFAAVEAWVHAGRPAVGRTSIVQMLRVAAPQIAVAIVYLALRHAFLPIKPPVGGAPVLPLLTHAVVVLESIGRFAALTFAPHELSIQQGLARFQGGLPVHSIPYVVVGALVLAAFGAAMWTFRKRLPAVTMGIAFFLVTLAPTSNIVNTQMETLVSERFLYLPLLGMTLVVGALLQQWPRRVSYAAAIAAIVASSVLSLDRAADYGNEDAFWARELALHPESSEARRARVRTEIRARRYRAALRDSIELTKWATTNQDVAVALETATLLSDLTPDHDRGSLEAIDRFCAELLDHQAPEVQFASGGLAVRINTRTLSFVRHLPALEHRFLSVRSNLHSRLGDDVGAVGFAKQSLTVCPRCSTAIVYSSLTLARAGDYESALQLLAQSSGHIAEAAVEGMRKIIENARVEHAANASATGPAALRARAAELAALELWGRAYDVLAPYKDEIRRAPKVVVGFAELAVRAGEPSVAREVLAGTRPPAEVEALIASWNQAMGWSD